MTPPSLQRVAEELQHLLQWLMGAPAGQVADDYMTTYINYYGIEKGDETYQAVLSSNIEKILADVFSIESIYQPQVDLSQEAQAYLTEELGFTLQEVSCLKTRLAG